MEKQKFTSQAIKAIRKKIYEGQPTTFLERNIVNMADKKKKRMNQQNKK